MKEAMYAIWDFICHPVARGLVLWICFASVRRKDRSLPLHFVKYIPDISFPEQYADFADAIAVRRPEYDTGIVLLEKMAANSVRSCRARGFLVDLYISNNQLRLAWEHCKKIEEENPCLGFWEHYRMGNILLRLGEHSDAIDSLRKAVEFWPESADAHCALGAGYAALGVEKEAEKEYLTTIALAPDSCAADFARKKLSLNDVSRWAE